MILCSGVFDGLHAGHVAYLEAAYQLKESGEPLIVAVASDSYVRRHKHREPTWTQADRMRVVQGLKWVSTAIEHGENGAAWLIREVWPRLFVKGDDWRSPGLPTDVIAACVEVGCGMAFVNSGDFKHTSDALSTHQ